MDPALLLNRGWEVAPTLSVPGRAQEHRGLRMMTRRPFPHAASAVSALLPLGHQGCQNWGTRREMGLRVEPGGLWNGPVVGPGGRTSAQSAGWVSFFHKLCALSARKRLADAFVPAFLRVTRQDPVILTAAGGVCSSRGNARVCSKLCTQLHFLPIPHRFQPEKLLLMLLLSLFLVFLKTHEK